MRHILGSNVIIARVPSLQGASIEEIASSTLAGLIQGAPGLKEVSRRYIDTPNGLLIEGEDQSDQDGRVIKLFVTTNKDIGIVAVLTVPLTQTESHQHLVDQMLASFRTFPLTGAGVPNR